MGGSGQHCVTNEIGSLGPERMRRECHLRGVGRGCRKTQGTEGRSSGKVAQGCPEETGSRDYRAEGRKGEVERRGAGRVPCCLM